MNVPVLWKRKDAYFHCNLPNPPQVKSGNTITCCQLQSVTKTHYALPGSTANIWAILIHPTPCDWAFTEPTQCTPCQDPRWTTVHSTKGSYGLCCLCMNALYALITCPCQTAWMSNATPPPQSLIQSFPHKAHIFPYIWLITLSNKEKDDNLVVLSGWFLQLAYQHLTVS